MNALLVGVMLVPAVLAPMAVVTAADAAADADDWAGAARRVTWDHARSAGFSFESVPATGAGGDVIRGEFALDDASFTLAYDDVDGNASDSVFVVTYAAVTEFIDLDGDGRYGLADRQVRRVALSDAFPPAFSEAPRFDDRGALHAHARMPLNTGGYVEFNVVVPANATTVGSIDLGPADVLVNITIQDPRVDHANSSLALETRVASLVSGRELDLAGSEGFGFVGDGLRARYAWSTNATVDGASTAMAVTALENRVANPVGDLDHDTIVIYSTPAAARTEIVQVLGFEPAPVNLADAATEAIKGDWRPFVAGLFVAAAIIGVSTISKLRSRTTQ